MEGMEGADEDDEDDMDVVGDAEKTDVEEEEEAEIDGEDFGGAESRANSRGEEEAMVEDCEELG